MRKIILTMLLLFITALQAEPERFVLTDIDGKQFNIREVKNGLLFEEEKGKAIFLIVFGHNCPPCKAEIPEFIELTERYKNKLKIIAIEAQKYSVEQLKAFREMNKINYNLFTAIDHQKFVRYIVDKANWNGAIPFLIAIDKEGVVQSIRLGYVSKKVLEELVKQLTN